MELDYFEYICMNGEIDLVRSMTQNSISLNGHSIGSFGQDKDYLDRGLYRACQGGHLDIIDLMIEKGACPNWGLAGACESANFSIIGMMIKLGADDVNSGLESACYGGYLDAVHLTIKLGANDWNRGLEGACGRGHLDIVKLMIELGADNWNIGLIEACRSGYLDIVKLMIELGANNWDLGLVEACRGEHLDIVKLMIYNGASNLRFVFDQRFNLIDSDIVNLIIEKNIPIYDLLIYPNDKTKILRLLELGSPVYRFMNIEGFDDLIKDVEEKQHVIKHRLSNYLIKDLAGIVAKYII